MMSSVDLQAGYVSLYADMRNYIWDLDVVEMLADVEVDVYDAFVDAEKLKRDYAKLYSVVSSEAAANKDESMQESADVFKQLIEDMASREQTAYLDLYQVQETVSEPLEEEDDEDEVVIEEEPEFTESAEVPEDEESEDEEIIEEEE